MSNKFLSLLLVLVMICSFVVPAFAAEDAVEPALDEAAPVEVTEDAADEEAVDEVATVAAEPEDEPAVAKRGDLADATEDEPGARALNAAFTTANTAITKADSPEGNTDHTYTDESWNTFLTALANARDMKNKYEAKQNIPDADLGAAATALTQAAGALNTVPDNTDVAAYKAKLAEAKALEESLVKVAATAVESNDAKAYDENNEKLTKAHKVEGEHLKTDGTSDYEGASIFYINKTDSSYQTVPTARATLYSQIDEIDEAIAEAKKYHTRKLSIALDAEKTEFKTASGIDIKFTPDSDSDFNVYVDDYKYNVKAKLNDGEWVDVDSTELKDKDGKTFLGAYEANAKIDGALIATMKDGATLEGLTKDDKITIVLEAGYVRDNREDISDVVTYEPVGEPLVITCEQKPEEPEAPAADLAAVAVGQVVDPNDATAKDADDNWVDVDGKTVKSTEGLSGSTDVLYITLNDQIKNSKGYNTTWDTEKYKLTFIKGAVTELPKDPSLVYNSAIIDTDPSDDNKKTYAASLSDVLGGSGLNIANSVKPGDQITVAVTGVLKQDTKEIGRQILASGVVTLKSLDKSGLKTWLTDKGLTDQASIEVNYGPYDKVTTLVQSLFNAEKGIVTKYLTTDEIIQKGSSSDEGTPSSRALSGVAGLGKVVEPESDSTATGAYKAVLLGLKDVRDLRALKAVIDEAKALKKSDHDNWDEGLMADALANAVKVYNALTHDFGSGTTFDANDDGKIEDSEALGSSMHFYTIGTDATTEIKSISAKADLTKITAANIATLTSELRIAIDTLIGSSTIAPDLNGLVTDDNGVTYYYADGVKQTGVVKNDGKLYYASTKGDNHILKASAKGGWITGENGKKYNADANGELATGYTVIGGKAYYFSIKDGHMMTAKKGAGKAIVTGDKKQYVVGEDGVLLTDMQTVGDNSYYCSVKDHHIFKAAKGTGTAKVTGTKAVYTVDEKGVIKDTKALVKG